MELSAASAGSDGGGSIRIPSSFCGIVGLKPTSHRVPAHKGVIKVDETVSVSGPMAGNVQVRYAL